MRIGDIITPWYPAVLASAYHGCDRYEEAIAAAKASIELNDQNVDPYLFLATSNAALERTEEAHQAAQEVFRIKQDFTLQAFAESQPYKDQTVLNRLITQLDSAGLAEKRC